MFPFSKFPGVDPILGRMLTGEVMGVGATFGEAMLKKPARCRLARRQGHGGDHRENADKRAPSGRDLVTWARSWPPRAAAAIAEPGCGSDQQGQDGRPHIVDMVKAGDPAGVQRWTDRTAIADSRHIHRGAGTGSPTTTMAGCEAATKREPPLAVHALQELHDGDAVRLRSPPPGPSADADGPTRRFPRATIASTIP